jgi:hypothetical protein
MTRLPSVARFEGMAETIVARAVHGALAGAVDYAGLFPPAALSMPEAAANYGTYRLSGDRWALGRFVIPAGRLGELAAWLAPGAAGWSGATISATFAGDIAEQFEAVRRFNQSQGDEGARVDAIEARLVSPDTAWQLAAHRSDLTEVYGEVTLDDGLEEQLTALATHRLRAKIRMGGVTAELFPDPPSVARFIELVVRLRLGFKATAGLHHPLRGEYRLGYDPASERGTMFGFLNLMLATLVAQAGGPREDVVRALDERSPGRCRTDGDTLAWHDYRFSVTDIDGLRRLFAGFGSCSFREPMDELNPALVP